VGRLTIVFLVILGFMSVGTVSQSAASVDEEGEKTYAISLTRTADLQEEIYELEDRKVLASPHLVGKGDYLWKILRKKGLLRRKNLKELLSILKKLNPSLKNLDLIHPGETVLIPLKIVPVGTARARTAGPPPEVKTVAVLKDMPFDLYTVRPGDSLTKVIQGRYDLPARTLYNEYLDLVKKLNPTLKNLDRVHPGQKIKLPIYSPRVVKKAIPVAPKERPGAPPPAEKVRAAGSHPLRKALGEILKEMGEEWIETGEHFVPLKSGGEIDLKAESYPIINLTNGRRVIVDLEHALPEGMAKLIEANWKNYRVVHLEKGEGLKTALDRILDACGYARIRRAGKPLTVGGEIPVQLTADWIVIPSEDPNRTGDILLITLADEQAATPRSIREYLAGVGVRVIDYPGGMGGEEEPLPEAPRMQAGNDARALVETVLTLLGEKFSRDMEIPVFQSRNADLKLTVKADFFMNRGGRDCVIDCTGLGADILRFLEKHRFRTLTLGSFKDAQRLLERLLAYLEVPFTPGPYRIPAAQREDSRNILLEIPGLTFRNAQGEVIFASKLELPAGIALFLHEKGYRNLKLPAL